MAAAQQHIVRKFSLELETADNGDQYKLQRRCTDMAKEKMVPVLDEILTAYFPGDAVTRINKIEIDLGDVDANKLEETFVKEFIKQLKQRIKNFAAPTIISEPVPAQLITKAQSLLEQFFYFLRTGTFPLTAKAVKAKEWEQSIISAVDEQEYFFREHFQQLIQRQPVAAERLAAQFDIDFVTAILNRAGYANEYLVLELLGKLASKITARHQQTKRKLLLAALIQMLCDPLTKDRESLLLNFKERFAGTATADAEDLQTVEAWKQYISAFNKKSFSEKQTAPVKKAHVQASDNTKEKQKDAERKKAESVNTSDGVFIDNAGLVILHPFLETLFKAVGFTENKSFIDGASRYRAVHLLQYMVSNEEGTPEYLMPLNKVLCGVPAEDHVERFIVLNENEKQEAQRLLQTVINYWSALKHTSVEGLQEAFLRRRGKLSFNKTDAYWKLQTEKSAIDILLDKLPWGYSYIQLPWMQHRLITEW